MGLLKQKSRSVVGLDVESGFLAATEFSKGSVPTLRRAATGTLHPGVFHDGEVVDVDGLAEQLKTFFQERSLPKRVRLGLASPRLVLRVLELPLIEQEDELEAAVRFQAQEELPMPLDQAALDYRILERFNGPEEGARMRVLVVAVRRESVEHLITAARRAGLTPELVDLSAFAMIRALYQAPSYGNGDAPEGAASGEDYGQPGLLDPATMYCYVGGLTNLAIGVGTTCVFNRVLPNGFESMAATLAEREGLTLEHSRQWLKHVGLEKELEHVEGDEEITAEARQVLIAGVSRIADEARLSLEYYASAVPNAQQVDRAVLAGPAITIAGLPEALEQELSLPVAVRSLGRVEVTPGALDGVDQAQVTVAAGLALDEVAP